MAIMFLTCICVVMGVTLGQDADGFFLLAGAAGNIIYQFENESFLSVPVSSDVQTMAFDPLSGRVYYGSVYSIHLYSMRLDGTDVRAEATTDLYVQAIAIDSGAGNMFVYSPGNTGKIHRVMMGEDPTLDQSNIIHTDQREVFYMAVDPKTRTLFWGSKTGVWQSNYDGTNKKNMSSVSGYYDGITVDDDTIYVIKSNKIFKIDRSLDPTLTEIFDIGDSSRAKSLVVVGESLYFGSSACVYSPTAVCRSSIATVQKDGTGYRQVSPVVSSETYGYHLTLAYVTNDKLTTTATLSTTSPVLTTARKDVDELFLLTTGDKLYKLENESSSTIPTSITIQTMAFDPMSGRVYYGSVYSIHLYSMTLDGTDVRVEATTDLYVQAIAIDSAAGNIFVYSPGSTGKIYRVMMGEDPTLDQSDVLHKDQREVFYMAVDPKTRTIFWGSTTGVWQSNYDGTNKKNMLSVFSYFDGITVDDRYVYGISTNKIFKIERSLDQTFTEIFDIGDSSRAKSLVVVGESLYFGSSACVYSPTVLCNSSIATVLIDGTGHRRVSPVLSSDNYGYQLTLVYVTRSNAKTTTASPVLTTSLAIMLPIVCLLVVVAIAVVILLWCKRTSGKDQLTEGHTNESPYNLNSVSHSDEDLMSKSYMVLKCEDNEKQMLEKMYREIDAKKQIKGPVGPAKTC